MNVLVIGAGMYVGGRGTDAYGTILPSLFRGVGEGIITSITVVSTSSDSAKALDQKVKELNQYLKTNIPVETFPKEGRDLKAYEKFSEGYDCVYISTPDHTHTEIATFYLRAGIPCMVVKPLAPTVSEVEELIALQEKKGVYGAVEFHKRFDKSNLLLKQAIEKEEIGKPLSFLVQYSQKKSIPTKTFKSWVDQTNIFQYLGIHYVDIIYFCTRAIPKRVMAMGQKSFLPSKGVDNYDAIQVMVEWDQDGHRFNSTFVTNWVESEKAPAMSDQRIKVLGTHGKWEGNQKDRGIHLLTEAGYEEPNPYFSAYYPNKNGETYLDGYGVESLLTFLEDVKAIKSGQKKWQDYEEIRPTFKESLIPTRVIEGVNQSLLKNGEWITLS